mgnify:CR=1 FL=1
MKIEKFKVLLYLKKGGQKAFDVLVEKRTDFEARDVKEALQGSVKTQATLLSFVDEHISELSTHEGIDMSKNTCQGETPARGVGADGEIRGRGKRYPFPIAEHESCSHRPHHHLQVGGNEQDPELCFLKGIAR